MLNYNNNKHGYQWGKRWCNNRITSKPESDCMMVFVFHAAYHVRLDSHSAINTCGILVGRRATIQDWLQPITVNIYLKIVKKNNQAATDWL